MAELLPGTASRTLSILACFSRRRAALRLREMVAELRLPTSSTAELLKELSEAGYLAFDPRSRSYFPTPKVTALGDWLPQVLDGNGHARAAAERLNQATGELILVGIPNGLAVQYVLALSSSHAVRYVVPAGVQRPLVRFGIGWALLSLESDAAVERCYRRTAMQRRDEDLPTLATLLATLNQIRKDRHGFSRNTVHAGASILAAPLPNAGRQRFAIGIGGPTERIEDNRSRYTALLLEACTAGGRISAAAESGDPP